MRKSVLKVMLMGFSLLCGVLMLQQSASAAARIDIDLSSQRMHVEGNGGSYDFPISSARSGYTTPRGYYRPQRLVRMHYSKKYHNSPMPHSIFFRGGYAIHGTGAVGQLGRPASHGCIRLSPSNAATLYRMVQDEGARIQITGSPPGRTMVAKRHTGQKLARLHHSRKHVQIARAHHRHAPRALAYAPQTRPAANNALRLWLFNPARR
jgi:L,D-transpeptidase catalytic domain